MDNRAGVIKWVGYLQGGCISISRECADYGQKLRAGFRGSSPHLTTHCQQRNMRIVTNFYYHLASTVDRVGIWKRHDLDLVVPLFLCNVIRIFRKMCKCSNYSLIKCAESAAIAYFAPLYSSCARSLL